MSNTIDFFSAMEVSASGLSAQRTRMNVAASNLANAQTTRGADGGPYKRRDVLLAAANAPSAARTPFAGNIKTVEVQQITQDTKPPRMEYDPGHPDANAQGYVQMPNVDTVTEMVDLIDAQRAYEANVTAMSASKQMFAKTLEILR